MKIKQAITTGILLITTFCMNIASAQTGTRKISPAEVKKNQTAANEFLRALRTGDVSKLGNIADTKFMNHGMGDKVGPDSLKSSLKGFYATFQPKVEVIARTSNGEYFGDWVRFISSKDGIVIEGIEMTKYLNGKALEHWFFPNNQKRTN